MADCLFVVLAKLIILGTCLNYIWADQKCKYTNSAMTCMNRSGKFLNSAHDTDINIIRFFECNLSALTEEDFSKYSNVHIISIFDSTILFPAQGRLFSGLQDLRELKISNSDVTEEVGIAFSDNKNILKVTFTGNKISAIPNKFFSHLKLIEEIDLSNNQIIQVEPGVFEGLSSLRVLNLSYNQIGGLFNPNFLILASFKCAVCRETTSAPECTLGDLNHCEKSKALDQLWWMSSAVTLHMEENPICSLAVENVNAHTTLTDSLPLKSSKDKYRCKVYEKGHCFKHESRRMFLLEACGFKRIPSIVGDREDVKILQTEIALSNNTVSSMHPKEGTPTKENTVFNTKQYIYIAAAIFAVIVIAALTKYIIVKNMTWNIENVPLVYNEHIDNYENSVDSRLHEAIIKNNLKKVKHLLASGVNPNVKDPNGELPILYAARVGNEKIIQELRNHAANINALNSNGQAAIHSAVGRGNLSTVQCLFYNKANINIKNRDGNPPLSLAVKDGHFDIAAFLISKGANVNERNNFQQLPIHFAARNGHTSVLELLISKGSEYGPYDDRGYTPLHNAARKGYVDIANILLKAGENVDVRNSSRNTPLHKAAKGGQMKMIEFLLENDADVQAINMKGHMPHTIARFMEHEDCERLLKQRLHEILNQGSTHREAGNM